jgi:PPOX class probable F420-dependent enzyme
MGELTADLQEFLDANSVGVLATIADDGRPRQSLVYFARDGNHLVLSTLAQRLKAKDVERSGWASLCVMGHEPPYPSAVFSGRSQILTEDIGAPTAAVMQKITGSNEPPEAQTDDALAALGRVVMKIAIEQVSAVNYVGASRAPTSG